MKSLFFFATLHKKHHHKKETGIRISLVFGGFFFLTLKQIDSIILFLSHLVVFDVSNFSTWDCNFALLIYNSRLLQCRMFDRTTTLFDALKKTRCCQNTSPCPSRTKDFESLRSFLATRSLLCLRNKTPLNPNLCIFNYSSTIDTVIDNSNFGPFWCFMVVFFEEQQLSNCTFGLVNYFYEAHTLQFEMGGLSCPTLHNQTVCTLIKAITAAVQMRRAGRPGQAPPATGHASHRAHFLFAETLFLEPSMFYVSKFSLTRTELCHQRRHYFTAE